MRSVEEEGGRNGRRGVWVHKSVHARSYIVLQFLDGIFRLSFPKRKSCIALPEPKPVVLFLHRPPIAACMYHAIKKRHLQAFALCEWLSATRFCCSETRNNFFNMYSRPTFILSCARPLKCPKKIVLQNVHCNAS